MRAGGQKYPESLPQWMTRPFTWEEILEGVREGWVSWRCPGRVLGGPTWEDRRERCVPAEFRDELPFAPGRLVSNCLWSGDPYGEAAHPDFHAKVMNTLERFSAAGLLTTEPGDPPHDADYTLYRLVTHGP